MQNYILNINLASLYSKSYLVPKILKYSNTYTKIVLLIKYLKIFSLKKLDILNYTRGNYL